MLGACCFSIIHRTLTTWTTGSLTCVRDHFYEREYTRGLGIPTASQHNIFDSEKLSQTCLVLLTHGPLDLESDAVPTEKMCLCCTCYRLWKGRTNDCDSPLPTEVCRVMGAGCFAARKSTLTIVVLYVDRKKEKKKKKKKEPSQIQAQIV